MKTIVNVFNEVNTTNYVDAQTGEILDEKKTAHCKMTKQEVKNKRSDLYFNVYYESSNFDSFLSLTGAELATLMACASASEAYTNTMLERYGYPGNVVVANAQFRKWVTASSGLKDSSVKAALSSLVKKDFLLRDPQTRGIYYLTPNVLFKGYSGIRTKLLNAPIYSESITVDEPQEESWAEATELPGSELVADDSDESVSGAVLYDADIKLTEEESDEQQKQLYSDF